MISASTTRPTAANWMKGDHAMLYQTDKSGTDIAKHLADRGFKFDVTDGAEDRYWTADGDTGVVVEEDDASDLRCTLLDRDGNPVDRGLQLEDIRLRRHQPQS